MKNRGKQFEHRLDKMNQLYAMQGLAKVEKVDPPSLVIKGRFVMKKNPFLDYIGHWTEMGKTLIVEAKFTEKPKLDLMNQGGVTENQYSNLWAWNDAGAVVCVLWMYEAPDAPLSGQLRLFTLPMLQQRIQENVKNVKFDEGLEVKNLRVPWDYLAVLQRVLFKKELAGLATMQDALHRA